MTAPVLVTLGMITVVLFIVGIIATGLVLSSRRRTALMELAAKNGLAFIRRDDAFAHALAAFPLFQRGFGRRAYNVITGGQADAEFWILEYQYTIRAGKHMQTDRQTVFVFPRLTVDLPTFELRPENLFHKIGAMFGYQDIDLFEHAEFSSRYLLRGPDADRVRSVFTPALVAEFGESLSGVSVEGGGSCLLVYRARRRSKLDALMSELALCSRLKDAFVRSVKQGSWLRANLR